MVTKIRAAVLAVLSALVGFGWISGETFAVIESASEPLLAGALAAWSLFAYFRARRDREESE